MKLFKRKVVMFMGDIISLAAYRKAKGIPTPRSPYYTLKATDADLQEALHRAAYLMSQPMNSSGKTPFAVLVGYQDEKGNIKLLKETCSFPNKEIFESEALRRHLRPIALVANDHQ